MARRRRKQEPEVKPDPEAWMTTFADLISLMLTFFILIVSMSTLDKTGLQDISTYFRKAVSVLHGGTRTEIEIIPPFVLQRIVSPQELMLAMRQNCHAVLRKSALKHKVKAVIVREELYLRIPNEVLFPRGGTRIPSKYRQALFSLGRMLAEMPGRIRVQGHAGWDEGRDPWRLSIARAAAVLHVLEQAGVPPERLALAGYGPAKPISTERTPWGRARNRRVEIVIYR